ncbi:MAG: hypothetical protein IPH11_12135 [Ignavibacteriales bacterium]|nr:hypothetical protein [Ignavibacteriales bacterium]
MKKLMLIVFVIAASFTLRLNAEPAARVGGFFYSSLSPHGTWIELNTGVTVWRPRIIRNDWSPYMEGQWIWTDDGWYWDSYEPFGQIVYHYGRWYYDDYYGWIWVPDYEWSPAWVEWRYDNDYIGWAPLSPYASFSISFGIHFSNHWVTHYHHWNFVRFNYFCDPYPYRHFAPHNIKYRIYNHTVYRTNYNYSNGRIRNYGVDVDYVRVRSKQDIKVRNLQVVRDPNDLRNNNGRNGDVRTLIVDRDELRKENFKDVEVTKSKERTSLETSKIELSSVKDRTILKENKDRNTEVTLNKEREQKVDVKENRNLDTKKNQVKVNEDKSILKNKNDRSSNESVNKNYSKENVKIDKSRTENPVKIEKNTSENLQLRKDVSKNTSKNYEQKKQNEVTYQPKVNYQPKKDVKVNTQTQYKKENTSNNRTQSFDKNKTNTTKFNTQKNNTQKTYTQKTQVTSNNRNNTTKQDRNKR